MTSNIVNRLVVALSLVVLFASSASALTNCTSGITLNSDTTLADDYYCTGSNCTCFTLTNGADLFMNGHTITCTSATPGTCYRAVYASAAGSRVFGCALAWSSCSLTPGGSIKNGAGGTAWQYGVYNGDYLRDVTFQSMSNTGAYKVKQVQYSVFLNCATAIETDGGVGGAVDAQYNFIDGNAPGVPGSPGGYGIKISPTVASASISQNSIRGYRYAGVQIVASSPRTTTLSGNIINRGNWTYPAAVPLELVSSPAVTTSGNICDDYPHCPPPDHGFILP